MTIDRQALRDELDAGHPVTGAYDADPQLASDQLNALNITSNLTSLTGDEIFQATDKDEFAALTDLQQTLWLSFCSRAALDPFGSANVQFVQFIFGQGSTTVANLAGLRTASISRAAQLGFGTILAKHVTWARNL